MPTKDQVAQMLNYDLVRRAKRADLALLTQSTPVQDDSRPSRPKGKPVAPVSTGGDGLENVYLDQTEDVQAALLKRGWIDDHSAW
ncbi:hypothetical protein D9M70_605410 [compost metagenome]